MPRLIRMTSDKNNGHFDNTFDDEIVLPPYSKMMLHNLQATLPPTEITIDSSNDQLKFQLQIATENPDGSTLKNFGEITTYIPHKAYAGEGAASNFLKQMENTMNGALSTNKGYINDAVDPDGIPVLAGRSGGVKECGGEWNIGITAGSTQDDRDVPFIQYNIQELYTMKPASSAGIVNKITAGQGFSDETIHNLTITDLSGNSTYYSTESSGTEGETNPGVYVYGNKFMARGGGVFSTYVESIDSSFSDVSGHGFVMGFCVEDPSTFLVKDNAEFPLSKIMYGVQYTSVSGCYRIQNGDGYNGSSNPVKLNEPEFDLIGDWDEEVASLKYKPQLQFGFGQRVETTPGAKDSECILNFRLFRRTTQGSGEGDLLSKYYSGFNRIDKNSTGGYVDSGSQDFTDHLDTTDLFPVVAIWSPDSGGDLVLRLADLEFTSSPTLDPPGSSSLQGHALSPSPNTTGLAYFDFPADILDFFNMNDALPTSASPFTYQNTMLFNGLSTIDRDINPESFVLELMTYQLDSYDGKTLTTNEDGNPIQKGRGKRMSILSTIPRNPSFGNRVLLYEGANPYYIDLNNEKPILMRQLFLRLLDFDLEPIVMRGRGALTLLVDK